MDPLIDIFLQAIHFQAPLLNTYSLKLQIFNQSAEYFYL
jgi:hypothetical protein